MRKKIILGIVAFVSIITLYTVKSEATFKISDYKGLEYFLIGTMEKAEFEKILNFLHFF